MARRKCPKCGSTDIKRWGVPQTWSKWECKSCGYIGAVVIEDGKVGFDRSGDEKKKRDQYLDQKKRGKEFY
jgi:hypothetical protein